MLRHWDCNHGQHNMLSRLLHLQPSVSCPFVAYRCINGLRALDSHEKSGERSWIQSHISGPIFSKLRTSSTPPNSLASNLQWHFYSGGSSYASTVAANQLRRERPMSADGSVHIVRPKTTWIRCLCLHTLPTIPLLTCYTIEWRNHRPSGRRCLIQRSLRTTTRSANFCSVPDT